MKTTFSQWSAIQVVWREKTHHFGSIRSGGGSLSLVSSFPEFTMSRACGYGGSMANGAAKVCGGMKKREDAVGLVYPRKGMHRFPLFAIDDA